MNGPSQWGNISQHRKKCESIPGGAGGGGGTWPEFFVNVNVDHRGRWVGRFLP